MIDFQFSAGAIVYRKEKGEVRFLLLRRHNGDYDLPKGHIEKGETAEIAARREIREESGLSPDFLPFYKTTTKYFFHEKGKQILKSLKLFIAKTDEYYVKVSYEHISYEWASFDQAVRMLKHKNYARILADVREYIGKWEAMQALNEEYARLPASQKGWDLSRKLVPGEGRLDAKLMLVGQAPGDNEDRLGRPFIGRSGRLLDSILRKARIRREDVYITSTVQFFPPKNRLPSSDEVRLCRGFLKRQIEIVKPRYILLLGNLASKELAGMGTVEVNHGKTVVKDGITYMTTYHPAAALRFPGNVKPMVRDMKKLAAMMRKK